MCCLVPGVNRDLSEQKKVWRRRCIHDFSGERPLSFFFSGGGGGAGS